MVTFTAGQKKGVESLRNAHLTPEYENMMFGARLGVLGSSEKEWGLHPKNEVKVEPATKMADFCRFFGFFQPKCWSFAILAPLYNRKHYGQHLVQVSKNDQGTLM